MLHTKFQFILYALQAMPLKVFWHDNNDFIQVFIIVPDVGNGVGETLQFRQQSQALVSLKKYMPLLFLTSR
jgi:hypothetical protein